MIQLYIYIHSFSSSFHHKILNIVPPVLYSRTLLLSILCIIVCIFISNPKLPIHPSPIPLPLGTEQFCSLCRWVFLCLVDTVCAVLCLVAQLCLTFCDPMDCSLPGSSVHRDSPARILELISMSSSGGSSQPSNQTQVSCTAGGDSVYLCPILDSICKWYHLAFVFLCLTSFLWCDNL